MIPITASKKRKGPLVLKKITQRQRMFIGYLLMHGNASKAARQAGYAEASAGQTGWKLLNDRTYAHVRAEYDAKLADAEEMQRIARQAIHETCMATIRLVLPDSGDLSELDDVERECISSLSVKEFESEHGQALKQYSLKGRNKDKACEILMKLHGLDRESDDSSRTRDIARENREILSILGEAVSEAAEDFSGFFDGEAAG